MKSAGLMGSISPHDGGSTTGKEGGERSYRRTFGS